MKKITLLTLLYSSIPMVIIIIFELSRIKDGYLSVEHAVIGDILLFILLGSSTFSVLLLVMYWKKTKPFIVGLLSLVLFPASFSAYILWGNIIFKDVTLLSLFMVLISVFYYLGKGNLFDQKKPKKVSPNKRREKPMKEILSITVLLILVFTGTAISQQYTPSQKLYHEWSMTTDIKPEQATHQISMGRHEIKIETIYEPIFSNSKEHLFKLVLNSRVYIDNILLWEGKSGSKVKCTALRTGNVVIEIDEKKVWPIN